MWTKYNKRIKRGSALLLTVLIITSMLLMLLGISRLIIPQLNQNRELIDASIADYAAKAGKEYLRYHIDDFFQNPDSQIAINMDTGQQCNFNNQNFRKDRCFLIKAESVDDPNQTEVLNVAVLGADNLETNNDYINHGIFHKLNQWIRPEIEAIVGHKFYFQNPDKPGDPKTADCDTYWSESLARILKHPAIAIRGMSDPTDDPDDSKYYDFLYLANVKGNGTGEIDLKSYFDRTKYRGEDGAMTLGEYLYYGGGHLFIDNAYGASISFPTSQEFNDQNSRYYDPRMAEVGFNWTTTNFVDNYEDAGPDYINSGRPDPKYNAETTIFKYVKLWTERQSPPMTLKNAVAKLQDFKLRDMDMKKVTEFPYIPEAANPSDPHPYRPGINGGYVEMATYSVPTHTNIAMQYFGSYINKGWVVIASSSIATSFSQGVGRTDFTLCQTQTFQSELPSVPYMFLYGLGDFGKRLNNVKVTGYYGGIQRTYQAVPKLTLHGLIFTWQEVPG